jgi:predicted SprT family Zn-dependent metalloprotease
METLKAEELAFYHMDKHGLIAEGWKFKWSTVAKSTHGRCSHGSKTIMLNFHWVRKNDEEFVLDTILHEIAHALTPGAKHGPAWKAKAKELGARPTQYDYESEGLDYRWEIICDHCKSSLGKYHRKPKTGPNRYHLACGPASTGKLKLEKL